MRGCNKLHARSLRIQANSLNIARSLAAHSGFSFLWAASGDGPSYVAAYPTRVSDALDPEPELALESSTGQWGDVPRWVGLLPYECMRGLERAAWTRRSEDRAAPHVERPRWLRYGAVIRVAEDVVVVGDDECAVERLAGLATRRVGSSAVVAEPSGEPEPDDVHRARIERALELIGQGEIYQVNLARRFQFSLSARAVDCVARFARRARAPFMFGMEHDGLMVAGGSPELFLELGAGRQLVTLPIKGTRPRGTDAIADRALARDLDADPKERAELAMVVDVERNDLGRIAVTGSVRASRAPRVRTFGSVHHRVARVAARLRDGLGREDALKATLPSGSVTGAPKVRAMEVIAELESERRGLYTGAFGHVGHDGSMRLAMAIRTLTAKHGVAHYFAGGGIVADSDPRREVEETRWKAVQMLDLLRST